MPPTPTKSHAKQSPHPPGMKIREASKKMLFLWHYMRLQQPTADMHEEVAEAYSVSKEECLKGFNDIKSVLEEHAKRMEAEKKIEELREMLEANKLKQQRSSPV